MKRTPLKAKPKKKYCAICNRLLNNNLAKYCSDKCKKKMVKRVKKVKTKGITKAKVDTLFSKKVRGRDKKCLYCGKTDYLNAHHIYSRNNLSIRWNLDNGITLCAGHHTFSREFSAHQTPIEFTEWLVELKGCEFLAELKKKAHQVNTKSLEDWYNELEEAQ